MKKVFYSPGPTCGCDIYEIVDFGGIPSDNELCQTGYNMAYDHYESYGDYEDEEIEQEYDYCWYDIDDPEVEGHI